MFNWCPHCGRSIDQTQTAGQTLICKHCGQEIGVIAALREEKAIDPVAEIIAAGTAARCPACQQLVQLKKPANTFVPHYLAGEKKLCSGSGKPISPSQAAPVPVTPSGPSRITSSGKDLSKYYSKDVIRVVWCRQGAEPSIEELTLEYLDKADRVRIQIEALREILGPSGFRMKDYPAALKRPQFAVWGNAAACVIAKKHDQGGYQVMSEAEILQVIDDFRKNQGMFFV
jgi:hypothetical protein